METRTHRLKQRLLDAPDEICPERAALWTEAHAGAGGASACLRNARALEQTLGQMTVELRDDEIIVGARTSRRKAAPLFPEIKAFALEALLDHFEARPIQPYRLRPDDKRQLQNLLPYWRGRTVWERAFAAMPRDLARDVFSLMFTVEAQFANGIGHFIVGNHHLLAQGFTGVRDEASARAESFAGAGRAEEADFARAVSSVMDAAAAFAGRYAAEAKRLAGLERDPARTQELETIAAVCARTSQGAPRSFHEAVQAVWFAQLICQLECGGLAISPGRLDQLLLPFYRRDLAAGAISRATALELIELLYLKMNEVVNVLDTIILPVTSGPPVAQSLTIGGVDATGADATNELSHLFLEAHDRVRLVSPNLAVRLSDRTPADFERKVFDAVRRGAMMSIFNDEVIIPGFEWKGASLDEARGYAIVGCVEPTTAGGAFGSTDSNLVNIARCLELALSNGRGLDFLAHPAYLSRKLGPYFRSRRRPALRDLATLARYFRAMGTRVPLRPADLYRIARGHDLGPHTGDPRDFASSDDLIAAFRRQLAHALGRMAAAMEHVDRAHAELKPTPFISGPIDDCLARGRDVTQGGARHNATGPQAIGLADVADSLAAIHQLVFMEKRVTMDALLEALRNNFEGHEELRQVLIHRAPKYGAGEPLADEMARRAAEIYCEEVRRLRNYRGGSYQPGIYSMSAHILFGVLTGATPNGRRRGDVLGCGVSPARGAETRGPTAVLRSVAAVDAKQVGNGYVLNMSFDPAIAEGEPNLAKFIALNRAYFKQGGLHVQHNVIDVATLREAQARPDSRPDLVVRVAGYSAFFTQLDRATQNDIINRVAHGCDASPGPSRPSAERP